jgi:hypothetical protein
LTQQGSASSCWVIPSRSALGVRQLAVQTHE